MPELKSLPPEFALLKRIGNYLTEYFQDSFKPQVARTTDLYEFLRHKEDMRAQFPTPKDFGRFLKKMHLNYESVMKQFINYKVIDTNPDFLQWFFYPSARTMIRETTDKNQNLAKTLIDKNQLKLNKKIYPAANGEFVRSLEELHIYNALLSEKDFSVYYERPLIAGGEERFPDFTILNRKTDTVFYWEHFGLSEKKKYMENMAEKIAWYQSIGISKIEDGGRFIATIFVNEHHFVELVDTMIAKMKEIVIPSGFIRDVK
ncbi:MAG TPA: hypothetical protein IAA79_03000 [Candidatus Avirikenella pullistercoris]|nr:hypothetical protein [Candidatus Avirikenella pullistercoris]